jgi:hypothetical protein
MRILEQISENIAHSASIAHTLRFGPSEESASIRKKLFTGIIDMERISLLENNLSQLCNQRLIPVQKSLFEMASK